MNIEPMFFAVFFVQGEVQDFTNSQYKRIKRKQFYNLIDEMEGKTVTLTERGQTVEKTYSVLNVKSFSIENSVDNHYFAIVEIKKQ